MNGLFSHHTELSVLPLGRGVAVRMLAVLVAALCVVGAHCAGWAFADEYDNAGYPAEPLVYESEGYVLEAPAYEAVEPEGYAPGGLVYEGAAPDNYPSDGIVYEEPVFYEDAATGLPVAPQQPAPDANGYNEQPASEVYAYDVQVAPDDILIWGTGDQVRYTDAYGAPLTGEWRINGVDYELSPNGYILAGGGALGSKGRLCVPAVGIDVAVNHAYDEDAQQLTDLGDSAAYVRYCLSKYYIADHNDQEFAPLTQVVPGDEAFLFTDAGIEAFACKSTMYGHNIESGLIDEAGNDLSAKIPMDGFVTYTCLDNWRNVHIVFWERTWTASTDSTEPTVHLDRRDAKGDPMERADSRREMETRTEVVLSKAATRSSAFALDMVDSAQVQRTFPALQMWSAAQESKALGAGPIDASVLFRDQYRFSQRLQERARALKKMAHA